MGKDGTRECRKESGKKVGNNKSKRKKPSSGVDNVGPNSPKSINKLDKGKTIKSEENLEVRVKRQTRIKEPCTELSTKMKTKNNEKKKKNSFDNDTGEVADNIQKEDVGLHQEKNAEFEKTPELRVKDKKRSRILENINMIQSPIRKTKVEKEKQGLVHARESMVKQMKNKNS